MVVNKRTTKNQPTPPKAVVEQTGQAGGASAVRTRLLELGMSEADITDAVNWARQA
jgi:ribosomal protein S28E/S33